MTAIKSVPKRAEQLAAELRRGIRVGDLRPGERLATVRDLAAGYGMSTATVQKGLGLLAAEGLIQRIQGSGTYVQETAAPAGLREVYLLMDCRAHVFSQIADSLVGRLQEGPYVPVMCSIDRRRGPEQFTRMFARWEESPPHAIVMSWEYPWLDEAIGRCCGAATRVLLTWRARRGCPPAWLEIGPDVDAVARLWVEHLVARGHRRIGLVTHARRPEYRKEESGHTPLILALGRALRRAGITKHGLTIHYLHSAADGREILPGDPMDPPDHQRLVSWLTQPDRPTALVGEDAKLVHALRGIRDTGLRVPEDIELLGIADTPWAQGHGFASLNIREDVIAGHMARLITADAATIAGVRQDIRVIPELHLR